MVRWSSHRTASISSGVAATSSCIAACARRRSRLVHAGGPARMLTPLFDEKLGLQDVALNGVLKPSLHAARRCMLLASGRRSRGPGPGPRGLLGRHFSSNTRSRGNIPSARRITIFRSNDTGVWPPYHVYARCHFTCIPQRRCRAPYPSSASLPAPHMGGQKVS